jgi:hypothetical protein
MSSKPSVPKTAWDYGFKIWLISLLGPFILNTIRYCFWYTELIQYQLLFNLITLIGAIPLSVFPMLLFNYTVKKIHGYPAHIIYKKLLLSVSYLLCLMLSIALPVLLLSISGNFLLVLANVLYLGLGFNILFGLAALWVLRIRID